jgi:hypothetical protein
VEREILTLHLTSNTLVGSKANPPAALQRPNIKHFLKCELNLFNDYVNKLKVLIFSVLQKYFIAESYMGATSFRTTALKHKKSCHSNIQCFDEIRRVTGVHTTIHIK